MSTMIKDSATTGPPSTSRRSSWFLGCFGCSGQKTKLITDEVNSGSHRRRSWIPKWTFRRKKSAAKTVPVDLTTVPKKSKSVNVAPASSDTTWEIQVVEDVDATLTKKNSPVKSKEQKTYRNKWTDSVKRQNGSYRSRRKETKLAAGTDSGAGLHSPGKKSVTISHSLVSSPLKPLTQSTSLPPPKRLKPPRGGGVNGDVSLKTPPSGEKFDSIFGMSIILVTLVIMLLWGKLCAILCTSAWFFIAPRLAGERPPAATAEERRLESKTNMDLESVEYKKKVVLEGLLQRNHRNNGAGRS